jgi:hypothetical protein
MSAFLFGNSVPGAMAKDREPITRSAVVSTTATSTL